MYPFQKLVLPSALLAQKNGQLPAQMLAKVKTGGLMYAPVAAHFNRLFDDALSNGIKLVNIGDYRSFDGQLKMFMDRYSLNNQGRNPQVTRQYEGKTWYLKPGKAPSAAPDPTGKKGSNHGWGLAMDLGLNANGKTVALDSDARVRDWMCANAPRYGFFLQTADKSSKEFEFWHWQYVLGDANPDGSVAPAAPATSAPAGTPALRFDFPGKPLRKGSKGDAVKLIQSIVGATPDGDFGARTEARVKEYQAKNGLSSDGVVGKITWAKMFG